MAIVFGCDCEDIEPVSWEERLACFDDTKLEYGVSTELLVFLDPDAFDLDDPTPQVDQALGEIGERLGAQRIALGYVDTAEADNRRALERLDEAWGCFEDHPTWRSRSQLLVVVLSLPDLFSLDVEKSLREDERCLGVAPSSEGAWSGW